MFNHRASGPDKSCVNWVNPANMGWKIQNTWNDQLLHSSFMLENRFCQGKPSIESSGVPCPPATWIQYVMNGIYIYNIYIYTESEDKGCQKMPKIHPKIHQHFRNRPMDWGEPLFSGVCVCVCIYIYIPHFWTHATDQRIKRAGGFHPSQTLLICFVCQLSWPSSHCFEHEHLGNRMKSLTRYVMCFWSKVPDWKRVVKP